jgi:4-hydroxyphenylpyruvate dioxygenase
MSKDIAEVKAQSAVEEIAVDSFDHVEFCVGNALQAAYFFQKGLGFKLVAYRGLETGARDQVSYVLKQDHTCIVLSGALSADSQLAEQLRQHGDFISTVAFKVRNVQEAFATAVSRGAAPLSEPCLQKDDGGEYVSACVRTFGNTRHVFVERHKYRGEFAPGFRPVSGCNTESAGLVSIDHIVGNVEQGSMDRWARFYQDVFGFYVDRYFDASDISTKYSALQSKVMRNKSGSIKLPINEPAHGLRKSQIQEFLDYSHADGVQHVALTTRDIVATVSALRSRGIEFLSVPGNYYEALSARGLVIDEDLEELARLGILVDSEDKGYLLQIFTRPIQDRPTFFFEVIQRKGGASGFGQGNFQALFEAIERDQARRGNL